MTKFFVKPAEGVVVRDPETLESLPQDGELKPKNSYWLHRLSDRDIEIATQSKKKNDGDIEKPAEGVVVRDSETLESLPQDGELKPKNSYWLHRLNDRDIEVATQSKKKKGAE